MTSPLTLPAATPLRDRAHRGNPVPGLLVAVLLLGAGDSIAGSYLVLFAADRLSLSPFAIGIFVSLIGVSGMAISTWLGRRYDRAPSRAPALFAVASAGIGYALLTVTTSYAVLLAIAATLLGAATAAFPQLFTMARRHLDARSPEATTRGTPALRSAWSLAWAIGPLVGGAVLAWQGYPALFAVAGLCFGLVAAPVLLLGPLPAALENGPGSATGNAAYASEPVRKPLSRPLIPVVASFTLFHAAMFSGSVVLPLYVTRVLDRPASEVGLLFTVCALVEIPAALGLMLLPARVSKERIVILAMVLFVGYFALAAGIANMAILILAQAARGVAIAIVGALGITYFQDLLPERTGHATTLFSNSATAGSLIAGVLAGATAQILGYRMALLLCGAVAAAAALFLLYSRRSGLRAHGSRPPCSDGRVGPRALAVNDPLPDPNYRRLECRH
jgi:MFS transporter, SET family, sugar efflux transporter